MEAFLEQNLASRFSLAGCRYSVHSETATSTIDWAYKDQLGEWLEQRPALVLVTLGANELDLPAPETRGWAVERIARRISAAGATCVWIAPLTWNGDTGMLRVIHDHSAPCLFFDSSGIVGELPAGERQRDGIHPNPRGGARWASALWDWLGDHRSSDPVPWSLVAFERRL